MINGLRTMVNERQARELHMARKRRELKNGSYLDQSQQPPDL